MADGSVISFSDGSVIAGVKHDDAAVPASTVLCSIVSGRAGATKARICMDGKISRKF